MTATADGESTMTIGVLARRTGVAAKSLRAFADAGLIYTVGRSRGNYRLFDEDALWCVGVIGGLRSLGLTVAEIRELAGVYLDRCTEPIGPHLAQLLAEVRARTEARVDELCRLLDRIAAYETANAGVLAGRSGMDFRDEDPRGGETGLDLSPGGKP